MLNVFFFAGCEFFFVPFGRGRDETRRRIVIQQDCLFFKHKFLPDMPKIVILDGHVANPGDMSWEQFAELGELTVYPRTAPDQVVERAAGADAIFTNKTPITAEMLEALPCLRFIGVMATGFNNVDILAARRRGVTVCNVPAYSTDAVAQTIFAHILNITNAVEEHSQSVHRGAWQHCRDFSYRLTPVTELSGLTMGIYGLGHIGAKVAEIARAFGMRVIALTSKPQYQLPDYITAVDRDQLFSQSDVLALCAPLTADNRGFVCDATLRLMKPSAILINTARGGLVDSAALARALEEHRLRAAGVDVLDIEPPTAAEPLLKARNCHITPHLAWQSDQARARLLDICADNLRAYLAGTPQNVVN